MRPVLHIMDQIGDSKVRLYFSLLVLMKKNIQKNFIFQFTLCLNEENIYSLKVTKNSTKLRWKKIEKWTNNLLY